MQKEVDTCTLWILRHGETEWNKKGLLMGQLDSPLTELGLFQSQQKGEEFRDIPFDAIYSSDLGRAQQTAEIIKLDRDLLIQTSGALRERTYGSYQGISREKYNEIFRERFDHMRQLSEQEQKKFKICQEVESDQEVIDRFITQLKEIANLFRNGNVLVVTHGGCIRTFLTEMGHVKYAEKLEPGSFANTGHLKVVRDNLGFFIKEIQGLLRT